VLLFLTAMLAGFIIAAPVGPVGMLAVHRGIHKGPASALATGLGGATGDTTYATLAAVGLAAVAEQVTAHHAKLELVGGLILLILGLKVLLKRDAPEPTQTDKPSGRPRVSGYFGDWLSCLGLTFANPMTLIAFGSVFAGLGVLVEPGSIVQPLAVGAGVFCGSSIWWVSIAIGIRQSRERLQPHHLRWISRVAGVLIVVSGSFVFGSAVWGLLAT